STPLEDSAPLPASSAGQGGRFGCLLTALLVIILLLGAGGAVYAFDPGLVTRAIAWAQPMITELPVSMGFSRSATDTLGPPAGGEDLLTPSATEPLGVNLTQSPGSAAGFPVDSTATETPTP